MNEGLCARDETSLTTKKAKQKEKAGRRRQHFDDNQILALMNDEFRVIDDIKEEEEEEEEDDDDGTKHENTPLRMQSKGGTVLYFRIQDVKIRCMNMYKDITKQSKLTRTILYPKIDYHFTCAKDASHLLPVLFSSTPVVFVRGFLF